MPSLQPAAPFPPGPRGLPLLGCALRFRRDPIAFLERLAGDYDDVAHFKVGPRHVFAFNHPDRVHEILVTRHRCFRKTGLVRQARPILGNGLLTSEGDFHTRQRRLVQPALHATRVSAYVPVVTDCTRRATARWQHGQRTDLFQQMLELTLTAFSQALFDFDLEDDAAEFEHAAGTAIRFFDRLLAPAMSWRARIPTPRNRRFWKACRTLDRFVLRMIEQARHRASDSDDLLSTLVRAHAQGPAHTDRQVRDEVLTLLAAGHESVATALTWTFFLLSRHPNQRAKIHAELDAVLAGRAPRAEDLQRLVYTRRVLTETMRLYPPLWAMSRECVHPCRIGDCNVPRGAVVGFSQYVLHRDPRYFHRPHEFDPDRWDDATAAALPRYAYFPFGGGPRLCVGEPFAWMEALTVLAAIARHWHVDVPADHQPRLHPLMTLRPRGGMPATLRRRQPHDSPCASTAAGPAHTP